MRRAITSWAAFGLAVYAFSALGEALRAGWQGRPVMPPAGVLALLGVFLASLVYLAFVLYAGERAAGRVRRRIALFDRLLQRGGDG